MSSRKTLVMTSGRVLATFDGVYHPIANGAEVALVSLLGGGTKLLIVSPDVTRGSVQWMADYCTRSG